MLRAFIVIVGFVTTGLSAMAIPFVLLGVVDAAVPFEALLTLFSVLVVAGTAILVLSEISSGAARLYRAIRGRRVSRRKAVSVVCWAVLGGTVVTSWLGYFSLSPLRYVALLRDTRASVGSGWLFGIATVIWRLACNSHDAGVHLAYYVVATLVLTSLACSLVDVVERIDPVASLLVTRVCAEEARRACTSIELASSGLWWFFGLSYDRLRAAVALATIAIVNMRYALTDRQHHVPTSPLKLALILRAVLFSTVELVPVAPILAVRTAATFLLGRAFIETLHAWGLPAALRAPRAFGRAVALRRACSGAAVSSRLTSSPAGS